MPTDTGLPTPPKPLNEEEQAQVKAWQRWMYRYYAFAMAVILASYFFAEKYGDSWQARAFVIVGVVALIAAATYVQFSGKCPRCGSRLGRQARFVLPTRCRACGVEFPKP